MQGGTISTHLNEILTLGSSGYQSPLKIESTGTMDLAIYRTVGLYAPSDATSPKIATYGEIRSSVAEPSGTSGLAMLLATAKTLANPNFIEGGYSGDETGSVQGGGISGYNGDIVDNSGVILSGNANSVSNGGYGIYLAYGTLTIGVMGQIAGGAGGNAISPGTQGGQGGIGVFLKDSSATNLGHIFGGFGGGSDGGRGTYSGDGGIGLFASGSDSTLSNSGTIIGGTGGYGNVGDGAVGVAIYDGATGSNDGVILGGAGGDLGVDTGLPGRGGYGLVLKNSSFSNNGSIIGGMFGRGSRSDGYTLAAGGGGVYLDYSSLSNSGTIKGNFLADGIVAHHAVVGNSGLIQGGTIHKYGLALFSESDATNSGTIIGGPGGFPAYRDDQEQGGVGVYIGGASTMANIGLISGYVGGVYNEPDYGLRPSDGGNGVVINSGILINSGTIIGGAGGVGYDNGAFGGPIGPRYGEMGDAVQFTGSGDLEVDPGAVFIGDVVADTAAVDGLYLLGSSTKALTGIGTKFKNFSFISFSGDWTIEGNAAGLTGDTQIFGMNVDDTIVLKGFSEIRTVEQNGSLVLERHNTHRFVDFGNTPGGVLLIRSDYDNTTLSSVADVSGGTLFGGQFDIILSPGTIDNVRVLSGGGLTAEGYGSIYGATLSGNSTADVISDGGITKSVLEGHAVLSVASLGTANSVILKDESSELLSTGGVSNDTTLDGGTLVLAAGTLSHGLVFKGTGGELVINQSVMPMVTIAGFRSGDCIKLSDASSRFGTVTVPKSGVVEVHTGSEIYQLNIAGAEVGETNFKFSDLILTETAPAMAIQHPTACIPSAIDLPELNVMGMSSAPSETPNLVPWRDWCLPYGGWIHELARVPLGAIQSVVTLHAF
jgi:hypothetical protein